MQNQNLLLRRPKYFVLSDQFLDQMNLLDIRPSCRAECSWEVSAYQELRENRLDRESAQTLCPDRELLGRVWRYLAKHCQNTIQEAPLCLCRKIVRWSDQDLSLGKLLTCLDIFAEVELIEVHRLTNQITIRLLDTQVKRDLNESPTMQRLLAAKEQ